MGLFSAKLICPQRWQSLLNSGLEFVLLEPGSHLAEFVKTGDGNRAKIKQNLASSAPQRVKSSTRPAAEPSSGKTAPASGAEFSASSAPERASHHASHQASHQVPAQNKDQIMGQTRSQSRSGAMTGAMTGAWPQPWDLFALKTTPERPFLWTHNELGQDLLAASAAGAPETPLVGEAIEARSKRSACTRQLLSALGLPGLVNFWPMSLPSPAAAEPAFTPQPEMFLEGVRRLEPTFLLVLGPLALQGFAPEIAFNPYTNLAFNDKVLLQLPCLNSLSENADSLQRAINFLRPYTFACRT